MTKDDVRDSIHEALVMYIDEISIIKSVVAITGDSQLGNNALEVVMKDGNKFRLIIQPI